ncbi:MAG: hypothetical protein WBL22_09910, partial [Candidatus Sulfotelmatobacter sp.]
ASARAPHAITQTADGYLWVGTEGGLVRFDGVRFVPCTAQEGKSTVRVAQGCTSMVVRQNSEL